MYLLTGLPDLTYTHCCMIAVGVLYSLSTCFYIGAYYLHVYRQTSSIQQVCIVSLGKLLWHSAIDVSHSH